MFQMCIREDVDELGKVAAKKGTVVRGAGEVPFWEDDA